MIGLTKDDGLSFCLVGGGSKLGAPSSVEPEIDRLWAAAEAAEQLCRELEPVLNSDEARVTTMSSVLETVLVFPRNEALETELT